MKYTMVRESKRIKDNLLQTIKIMKYIWIFFNIKNTFIRNFNLGTINNLPGNRSYGARNFGCKY